MSYKNFIPRVWAKEIEHELERKSVFSADTNRKYEGKVSQMGDTVKILGVGKPTIKTQVGGKIVLPEPETVESTAIAMPIEHIAYYNYEIDDIDKRQGEGGIVEALSKESSLGLAGKVDAFIADLAKDKLAVRFAAQATALNKDNILNVVDLALTKLYDNDVQPEDYICMTVSPWFYMLMKQAYIKLDTDNSGMLENGKVGKYGNVIVKMSNRVAKDTNGNDLVQIKTKNAIAFAQPMTHTEPYRPQQSFSDAVKGFILYDGKVVRPKEMVVLNCKPSA